MSFEESNSLQIHGKPRGPRAKQLSHSLESKIAGGFAAALLLLCAVGFVSYRSTQRLIADNRLNDHSRDVLDAVAKLISEAKDAETGQRGFVITGDDAYLEPNRTAVS